ncbi:flagellar protein FlgN [Pseudomonas sp.]|jgi:flagella synthesis protein FlgN|uniref:flagella synthesis protein FlgN n=1 Tax=Pseudomonas sp. TaxID=306 RepID=UPI0028B03D0A|nr:flagellar protein FlgN [Pseudomonas sp.]
MNDTTLLQLFIEDIGHAEQLLELLESETQALTHRDLASLETILTSKQTLLALLDQHGKQRSRVLVSLNLSADRAGLQVLAKASAKGEELLAAGDRLSTLLRECQDGNLRNGRLIRASQTSVTKLLGILRGAEAPNLYNNRGATSRTAYQRPLSQA